MPTITLIDNYDSFTYNLVHYLQELGATVNVVRNDASSAHELLAQKPDGIVISPGPCSPNEAGMCLDIVKEAKGTMPIFGVCLGHQVIGQAYGGTIVRAPVPMHGKISQVYHQGKGIFKGLPSPFNATRYHSLIIERTTCPKELEITAETRDGMIMAVAHVTHPVYGVQFHPESIASEHGHALLKHFLEQL